MRYLGHRVSATAAIIAAFLGALLVATPLVADSGSDPARAAIQERVEQLRSTGRLAIDGESLAGYRLIPAFYEARDFRPAWTRRSNVEALLRIVGRIDEEGLDPEDYFLTELRELVAAVDRAPDDPAPRADLDLLLTESLARLGYHLRFGKVNPEQLDPDWNLARDLGGRDPVPVLQEAIDSGRLEEFIQESFPRAVFYERLKAALARYRRIDESGGWPRIPDGPVLKPGTEDDRVPALRQRLARAGDLAPGGETGSSRFDAALVDALTRFQQRHGLDADGVIGQKTLDALNVTARERVDQIRVNLERARWVMQDLESDFVIVNIAGFRVWLFRENRMVWSARAQVGKPYRKTPVFKAMMKFIEINPTWTVPPTILAKDVLPAIERDPGYLRAKDMKVLDRSGKSVDPAGIDWASYSGRGFPYTIRQEPGPGNALGRVKFIFPNEHFVFLHDTPSKSLFGRAERAFSSGCIRVEHPFELAELLLEGEEGWDGERIREVLDSKQTRRVFPSDPLPVLLLYWTADPTDENAVGFHRDLYGRDAAVLEALNAEFTFSAPRGVPDYLAED